MGPNRAAGNPACSSQPASAVAESMRTCYPQDPCHGTTTNMPSVTRAGRLLGRCHAALGEDALAVAALDASLAGAKTGELLVGAMGACRTTGPVSSVLTRPHSLTRCSSVLHRPQFSEALAVRSRVLVGKSTMPGGDIGPHWNKAEGKQRLQELMGRMDCERTLVEKFLVDGL